MNSETIDMFVTKRNGSQEVLDFRKILERTRIVGNRFQIDINYNELIQKVMDQLYNHIKTSEIDELMCQQCASLGTNDYGLSLIHI